jgi:hypothetical protein
MFINLNYPKIDVIIVYAYDRLCQNNNSLFECHTPRDFTMDLTKLSFSASQCNYFIVLTIHDLEKISDSLDLIYLKILNSHTCMKMKRLKQIVGHISFPSNKQIQSIV